KSSEEVMDFKCDELILGKKDADSRALTLAPTKKQSPTAKPIPRNKTALVWSKRSSRCLCLYKNQGAMAESGASKQNGTRVEQAKLAMLM
ncbi:hypothetical protein, partial [Pseudaeromonas pectinilytica]